MARGNAKAKQGDKMYPAPQDCVITW